LDHIFYKAKEKKMFREFAIVSTFVFCIGLFGGGLLVQFTGGLAIVNIVGYGVLGVGIYLLIRTVRAEKNK
jgi:MFS-type transporter involved in bile tolerance (Atg22 family)